MGLPEQEKKSRGAQFFPKIAKKCIFLQILGQPLERTFRVKSKFFVWVSPSKKKEKIFSMIFYMKNWKSAL